MPSISLLSSLYFLDCLPLKMKALWSFKTFVTIYQSTRCSIAGNISLQLWFCLC